MAVKGLPETVGESQYTGETRHRTGLKGYYDFDVQWSAPKTLDGQRPAPQFGAEGAGLLISTLQELFGLRLTNATGPVEYWVVDHVEPPADN